MTPSPARLLADAKAEQMRGERAGEPASKAIEVVETLHRRDLPKAEKDKLIRRYAELAEQKRTAGVSETEFPKPSSGSNGQPRGATSAIAASIGISKREVNRAIARDKAHLSLSG